MNMYQQQESNEEDGFAEDRSQNLQEELIAEQTKQLMRSISDQMKKQMQDKSLGLPPGKSIISTGKKYSLYPDIATGWMPKDMKCHPIPITADLTILDMLYEKIHANNSHFLIQKQKQKQIKIDKQKTQQQQIPKSIFSSKKQMILCYYGPRYSNTYYAWYKMPFEFPYTHLQPPTNMKSTNRHFNGQHPTLHHFQPNTLIFDSFFENGNLDCAIKINQYQYDLYLRVDSNTRGHFQWYNFKIKNIIKGIKYKFNICNLQKDYSLYQRGMKPYILSYKAKQKMDKDWCQDGENIKYQKKASKSISLLHGIIEQLNQANQQNQHFYRFPTYFKLSFQISTIYDNDTMQIAYSVPYTFTDLTSYLQLRKRKCENHKFYNQSRLCMSLGGLPVPLITINQQTGMSQEEQNRITQLSLNMGTNNFFNLSPGSSPTSAKNAYKTKKKCIVIGCRVHPGEPNASYVMQGLLDFLCSNKIAAKYLRSKIVFKIVPMLNPDGVCLGNYRTGLSGRDFNRQYLKPDARLFPQIYCFKKLVLDYKKKFGTNFMMFLDLHGHAVKKNVFMYGPQNSIMDKYYYQSRIFPKLMSKKTEMFRYYSCVFKIQQDKKTTARAVFQQIHDIPLCYTIEASNGSYYSTQILKDFPFNSKLWKQVGHQLGITLQQYLSVLITAQKAKYQRYQKNKQCKSPAKQQCNYRTSKLIQKRKQKKKANNKLFNFHQGQGHGASGIARFNHEVHSDEDLFKYLYNQISQAVKITKPNNQKQQIKEMFEQQNRLLQGHSDSDNQQNNLQPEKLEFIYQAIKRKHLGVESSSSKKKQDIEEFPKKKQKQFINTFKNEYIQSRARSAMEVQHGQNWSRLSQPKKSNKAIVNLTFQTKQSSPFQRQSQPITLLAPRTSYMIDLNKKNRKNFQDFVSSFQKWEKTKKKDSPRPVSSMNKSTLATIGNTGINVIRNYSLVERKSYESDIYKKQKMIQQDNKNPKVENKDNVRKRRRKVQNQELERMRHRTTSPVRNKHYIDIL